MEAAEDPIDALETAIGLTSKEQRQVIELLCSQIGLTLTQGLILEYLGFTARNGETLNQTELAERLHLRKPATSAAIDILVARGLVQRIQSPADRRAWLLALTEEGWQAFPEMFRMRERAFAVATQGLRDEDLVLLTELLAKIRRNLVPLREDLELQLGEPPDAWTANAQRQGPGTSRSDAVH